MADTYSSFVLGYIVFWALLFGSLVVLFIKTKKIETQLMELEKQIQAKASR